MTDTGHAMTSWYYHNSYCEIYTVAKMLYIHAIDMNIIHQNIQNILVSTKFFPFADDDRAHFFPYFVVNIFVSSSLFSSVSLYNFRMNHSQWNLKVFIIFASYRIGLIILSTLCFRPLSLYLRIKTSLLFWFCCFFFVFWHVFYLPLTEICTESSTEKCWHCINGRMSQP